MWKLNIGAAALVALTSLPALAGTATLQNQPLLGGDATSSIEDYRTSVNTRLRAVNSALRRVTAADDALATTDLRTVQRTLRAVNLDLSEINRDLQRLEKVALTNRVDVQADIEAAFARIDVRFDVLGNDVTDLASALDLTAQTRARAAETYDPSDEDANTIAGVFVAPRTAYGVGALNRLRDLSAKVDRLEASAGTTTTSRSTRIHDTVDDLRADLRTTARVLDNYDAVSTRGEMHRVRADVEARMSRIILDVEREMARFSVR